MSGQGKHEELMSLAVERVMSSPVVAIVDRAPLGAALATLMRTGLRHLAVVDAHSRCLGVVGDRAIAAAWAADPTALECVAVAQVLDRRLPVVGADATVGEVARVMHTDRVDAVAVIDRGGRPVGLVTGSDLIALMARHVTAAAVDHEQHPVRKYGPGRTGEDAVEEDAVEEDVIDADAT